MSRTDDPPRTSHRSGLPGTIEASIEATPNNTNAPAISVSNESALITEAQLAERWQCAAGSLRNWRSRWYCTGVLVGPPWVNVGSRVRYRLSDILAFEVENKGGTR